MGGGRIESWFSNSKLDVTNEQERKAISKAFSFDSFYVGKAWLIFMRG